MSSPTNKLSEFTFGSNRRSTDSARTRQKQVIQRLQSRILTLESDLISCKTHQRKIARLQSENDALNKQHQRQKASETKLKGELYKLKSKVASLEKLGKRKERFGERSKGAGTRQRRHRRTGSDFSLLTSWGQDEEGSKKPRHSRTRSGTDITSIMSLTPTTSEWLSNRSGFFPDRGSHALQPLTESDDVQRLEKECETLRETRKRLEREAERARKNRSAMEDECKRLRDDRRRQDTAYRALWDDTQKLRDEFVSLNTEFNDLDIQRTELEHDLTRMGDRHEKARENLTAARVRISELQRENKKLHQRKLRAGSDKTLSDSPNSSLKDDPSSREPSSEGAESLPPPGPPTLEDTVTYRSCELQDTLDQEQLSIPEPPPPRSPGSALSREPTYYEEEGKVDAAASELQPPAEDDVLKEVPEFLTASFLQSGAFAAVYEVSNRLKFRFALKRVDLGREGRSDVFDREISTLRRVQGHKNIIVLKRAWKSKDKGIGFMLMELGGGDLFSLLETSLTRRLRESYVRKMFPQMLKAVRACHEKGVAHRDIKLENFVIDKRDPENVKLIDFNHAQMLGHCKTCAQVVGTTGYMAPEMIRGNSWNFEQLKSIDMYSLGVCLYAMLTGLFPPEPVSFPKYMTFSPDVKSMTVALLDRDSVARMRMSEALHHSWLKSRK